MFCSIKNYFDKLSLLIATDGHELLNQIGLKRGCIRKGGLLDDEKVIRLVIPRR